MQIIPTRETAFCSYLFGDIHQGFPKGDANLRYARWGVTIEFSDLHLDKCPGHDIAVESDSLAFPF